MCQECRYALLWAKNSAHPTGLDAKFPDSANVPHNQHIVYVADRPGHDRRYAIDNSKICSELGYIPVETFQSGLAKTLDWYLARPEFWRGDVKLFGAH